MRRSLPTLVLYAPAIALLAAGIVVLATSPLTTTPSCSCASGSNCTTCPVLTVIHPLGPLLLLASGLYASGAYLARVSQRPKPAAKLPPWGST